MAKSSSQNKTQLLGADHVLYNEDPSTALMIQVREGNLKAFEQLYANFKGPAMAYVRSFISESETAEEVSHEAFLKIYRSRESYEPTAKFQTWFWTILRNTAMDSLRKNSAEKTNRQILSVQDLENQKLEQVADPESFEEGIFSRAQTSQIEDCLKKIPDRQREALVLKVVSDLSYEEIAQQIAVSLATVKSLIFRSRQSLTDCLGGSQ